MSYGRLAAEITAIGAQIKEMREHREALEARAAEARAAEAANKQEETLRAATSPTTAAETSSQMLSQQELMSMNPKQLQNYISSVQKEHDSQKELQRQQIKEISRASGERTEELERRHYEAQMRQYKANLNNPRTIERLLLEQKNLP